MSLKMLTPVMFNYQHNFSYISEKKKLFLLLLIILVIIGSDLVTMEIISLMGYYALFFINGRSVIFSIIVTIECMWLLFTITKPDWNWNLFMRIIASLVWVSEIPNLSVIDFIFLIFNLRYLFVNGKRSVLQTNMIKKSTQSD